LGSLLIPTSCVSEEGTSPHYIKDDERIRPDAKLVASLEAAAGNIGRRVFKGPQWTTDAPYRELIAKIEAYRKQGVLGVDMETSAMYALGQFRGVRVCNLLVVSDELWSEWNPAFGTEGLQAATKRAEAVIARLLEADNLLVR
jgi:uridine phosphorylase